MNLFVSVLNNNSGGYDLSSILKFYTDFADPLKDVYSWNKSLGAILVMFLAGRI